MKVSIRVLVMPLKNDDSRFKAYLTTLRSAELQPLFVSSLLNCNPFKDLLSLLISPQKRPTSQTAVPNSFNTTSTKTDTFKENVHQNINTTKAATAEFLVR